MDFTKEQLRKIVGFSIEFTAVMSALGGCGMFLPPRSTPEFVPVQIEKGGPLQSIDMTLYVCTYVEAVIYFPKSELRDEQLVRLVGGSQGGGWKPAPGIPIRMKVVFDRLRDDGSSPSAVKWRVLDNATETIGYWSSTDWGRIVGGVTLPAGRYRVQATLVEGRPQMAALHPKFAIWSSFKTTPSSKECVAGGELPVLQ